jgi:Putative MetA-pathway of phenol degradation
MWKVSVVLFALAAVQLEGAEPVVSPAAQLREMNALFLSPYTVDPNHWQIESYLVGYAYAEDGTFAGEKRTTIWNIAPTTVRYGALKNLDLEVAISPYTFVDTEHAATHSVTSQRGFGDIFFKTKLNLWGDDSGSSALALMPWIKVPTAQDHLGNDRLEGGLTIPIALELPRGLWLFLSPEASAVEKTNGRGYTAAFRNTTTLWHQIVGELSGYIEFVNWVPSDVPSEWYGTADAGCTYMLTKNVQLDAGVLIGVTRTAPDINPFVGLSVRF